MASADRGPVPPVPAVTPGTVSVAMIVRDEERCLDRCLRSVAPHVEQVVVVDTGSVDRTVEIARSHGALVVHEPWRDDFAAARNVALEHASGEHVLVLDADEWLADPAGLDEVRRLPPGTLGEAAVVSATGDGPGATTAWQRRLLPAGTRYAGRVHEQPVHDGPVVATGLRIEHDGYLPEQLAGKRGRNTALIEAELRRTPGEPYLLVQLGRAYEGDERHTEAADTYERALAVVPAGAPVRHDVVVRALHAYGRAGRTQQALDLAEAEMPHWQDSPDFFFCLGGTLMTHGLAHPEDGPQVLPLIESAYLRCLEIGERPERVGAVAGRGSHLAAHNLAVLYDSVGDAVSAARYRALAAR